MKVCTNCKKELPDDAVFCDNCGTRVETVKEIVAKKEKGNHGLFRKGILILGVIVVVAGVVLGVIHFAGRNTDAECNTLLLSHDNELMFVNPKIGEPITLGRKYVESLYYQEPTEEDEYEYDDYDEYDDLFYDEDEEDQSKPHNQSKVVADSWKYVTTYKDEKRIIYPDKIICNAESSDIASYSLYYCKLDGDDTESIKIDSDVSWQYQVIDHGNKIVYQVATDLYMYDFEKEDKEQIAGQVCEYYMFWHAAEDGSYVDYISEKGDVYRQHIDGEIEEIATGLSEKDNVYEIAENEVYYTITEDKSLSIADYVEDDLPQLAEAVEPEYPTEPDPIYADDYENDAEWEKALKKAEKEYKKWEKEKEAYDEAYAAYEEAATAQEERKEFWDKLRNKTVYVPVTTVYYYDGKQSQKVAEDVIIRRDEDEGKMDCEECPKGGLAAIMYDFNAIGKIKASDYLEENGDVSLSDEDIESTFEDAIRELFNLEESTNYCWIYREKCYDLTSILGNIEDGRLNSSGDQFIYLQDEELKEVALTDGMQQKPVTYDKGVTELEYVENVSEEEADDRIYWKDGDLYFNKKMVESDHYDDDLKMAYVDGDTLYYYTDVDEENENRGVMLYACKNGQTKQVASDVKIYSVKKEADGHIYYLKDYDDEDQEGSLYCLEESKPDLVVDNVREYYVSENGSIYYTKNYDFENYKSDLYLHGKKKDIKIQSGIEGAALPQWK